jgi:hypothetical protein
VAIAPTRKDRHQGQNLNVLPDLSFNAKNT